MKTKYEIDNAPAEGAFSLRFSNPRGSLMTALDEIIFYIRQYICP